MSAGEPGHASALIAVAAHNSYATTFSSLREEAAGITINGFGIMSRYNRTRRKRGGQEMDIENLKQLLNLKPLPEEGGYYYETYRSNEKLARAALPARYASDRHFGTAIYFLLTPDTFSAMHRLLSDEVYHFYMGDPVEILCLREDGAGETVTIGTDLERGMRPQCTVPHGTWQGSRLRPGGKFALLGTTMAPAFDFADFELANRAALVESYPAFAETIRQLTR